MVRWFFLLHVLWKTDAVPEIKEEDFSLSDLGHGAEHPEKGASVTRTSWTVCPSSLTPRELPPCPAADTQPVPPPGLPARAG